MFNLQGSEIIIVLLLALVVLGPEKLPDAMRKMGQFYAELKKMSTGFQNEFKAAVDEPMRELRDTANVLRDSADFTKLQDGDRAEKPKSGEMPTVGDPEPEPVADLPTFDQPTESDGEPALAEDSKPAPFSGVSSAAPRPPRADIPTPPPPFSAMAADVDDAGDDEGEGHGEVDPALDELTPTDDALEHADAPDGDAAVTDAATSDAEDPAAR